MLLEAHDYPAAALPASPTVSISTKLMLITAFSPFTSSIGSAEGDDESVHSKEVSRAKRPAVEKRAVEEQAWLE